MAGFGALQPMTAGFAAGLDLAGTSGAGIACSCPEGEINDRRKQRPIRIPWMLESGISAGMTVSSARAASTSGQDWKRAASVNNARSPRLVDRQRGWLFKQGRAASPRQSGTRGRCCRRRSPDRGPGQASPVRRPARPPRFPRGSSRIAETSTRCAGSPSPTSCCPTSWCRGR
jgi:hypothetical protein